MTDPYKLVARLSAMEFPDERSELVTDAAGLLAALVHGADNHGRYFADEYLLKRLFWWQWGEVPASTVALWRDELVRLGEITVEPLGRSCYGGGPVLIASIVDRTRFTRFAARPHIPDSVRALVYERDGHACLRCGATTDLSLDHVHPYSRGGSDEPDNLQTLCRSCNSAKGARVEGERRGA
ncbi:HNH endonuclease [Streptosporangium sp. NPDC020145]|uniref:HNH endonuclease n=1 Tax=Streptosporangium sp. NPDC020145 TaxID=3154694 RepID=UPI0034284D2E